MPEHSITLPPSTALAPAAAPGSLLATFLELLLAVRPAFRQERTFRRGVVLGLAHVLALGRHTIAQLLAALGLDEDWSACYRLFSAPRLDGDEVARRVLVQTLALVPSDGPYVAVIDGVQVPRHSRTMPYTAWLHNPSSPPFKRGIQRAQRFLDLACLLPVSPAGYSRAVPLSWQPAPSEKALRPDGVAAVTEAAAGLARLGWLRAELDAAGRTDQLLLGLGDGAFGTAAVWRELPERTVLVARCRRNRALWALPPARLPGQRGRPRKYGERARTPEAWLRERGGWQAGEVVVRGRSIPLTYRVEGPYLVRTAPERPLFLLVVRGIAKRDRRHKRRAAACFLVNAVAGEDGGWGLPLPAEEFLAWAWQRWEVEVTHRECKTDFGVGEVQCWGERSAVLAVQWQVWLYSLLVLAGYRCWGLSPGPVPPLGPWWRGSRRWSLGQLQQALRGEVWELAEFRPRWAGTGSTWEKIEGWAGLLLGSVRAARRT